MATDLNQQVAQVLRGSELVLWAWVLAPFSASLFSHLGSTQSATESMAWNPLDRLATSAAAPTHLEIRRSTMDFDLLRYWRAIHPVHGLRRSQQEPRRSSRPQRVSGGERLETRALMAATGLGLIAEPRSYDGSGNNFQHTDWGSTGEQLLRKVAAEYADGISTPAGTDRPGAREISNELAEHSAAAAPNDRNLTAFIYIWGQFLDHDLDLTKANSPAEAFSIPVPAGDASFDPNNLGNQQIPVLRSVYDPATGSDAANPRQQINQVTAWIDGSMIYGSDAQRAAALRTFVGGKLQVTSSEVGDLLPLNTNLLPMANDAHRVPNDELFLAGDIRANENIELTSLQTLFVREHNRLADGLTAAHPDWSDEQLYQAARAYVIGELQAITYNEWLPALLGRRALPTYRGYDANVNPGIANEFSTAAFRLHSTVNDDVEFFGNDGRPIAFSWIDEHDDTIDVDGEISLAEAFFNPTLFSQTGLDGILKYAASTKAEELDLQIVDSLRNFLFGQPGQGGLDLAALNIQRGRDHGLADYNATRVAYGLAPVTSFADITDNVELQQVLADLYGSVDNIDLWVGALAEDHVPGSSTGELTRAVLLDQFQRLRAGDRFWYARQFSPDIVARIDNTRLSDIIERNSGIQGLQDNVFFFRASVQGEVFSDTNGDSIRNGREPGLAAATVQLLDDAGEVLARTTTDRQGRFTLVDFPETGDFVVQVTGPAGFRHTTPVTQKVHIASGDMQLRGLRFGWQRTATTNAPRPRRDQLVDVVMASLATNASELPPTRFAGPVTRRR